jgi:small-conductance mechanosensitive channel
MFQPGRLCRAIVARVVLACAVVAVFPAHVAEAQTNADVPALPDTLTRESVRDLLSRLSDAQVRNLLIDQLDRTAAVPAKPPSESGMAAMAGMAGMVDQHAGTMRSRYDTLYDALRALPATVRDVAVRLAGAGGPSEIFPLFAYLVALLATGAIAERVYVYALRRYRVRLLQAQAATFSARAFQLGVGLLLDLGGLAVFGAAAIVFFFALWLEHELRRIFVLEVLFAVVVVRIVAMFARFLLSPAGTTQRLLPFADAPARRLRRFASALAAIYGLSFATIAVFGAGGASPETGDLAGLGFWILALVLTLATVWRVRKPIADLIRGDGDRSAVIGWLADLWPVAATAYFLALLIGGIFNVLAGTAITTGTGFASVLLVVALPIVDMALCRALGAVAARRRASGDLVGRGGLAAYEPIFRRAVHIVVIVVGLLMIAGLWDLDLFALAQKNLGGKIASSLLGISIVLLATYMLWEIFKTAIDRRLQAEGEQQDDVPATRLRTVLPILRATILVTIVVMAAMSVLAALGVDILPLLAGAGVVGVAIGFGSQTLVRDIVSGAFFLMDDAFRLGEYIEVGDAKGRVERINLRSVFLRHHRGALNILPYGEIKRLRNTSRDWSIHVMEFRLTYDTSMLQVKKILKQIGDELSADPDYAHDLLQPLKSAGVISAEDSAIVVRAKFTARPTSNAWVIRRVAYDKIIRAFRAAGIKFAHRQVTVNVPPSQDAAAADSHAGAALAIEAPGARTGNNPSQP